ncbi:MAG: TetR/AcrR family transcriptional regulator [Maledivibacter sp.]|jgi:AcrR family transcriptional regulator|nr:TetR/AcrR family transcriptional regulator [Maledivibacter sp.]
MNKKDILMARKIFLPFTRLSYKKTTMQDIANATGMSRQSIYKKFGSKEKCYNWAIQTYLSDMYSRIFEELSRDQHGPFQTLQEVFEIFIGEGIDIINHSYGTNVLDDVLAATYSSEEDWHVRFTNRLADFLVKNDCVTPEKSLGIAMALISSGKGLLLVETSKEQFKFDMTLIIKSVIDFK